MKTPREITVVDEDEERETIMNKTPHVITVEDEDEERQTLINPSGKTSVDSHVPKNQLQHANTLFVPVSNDMFDSNSGSGSGSGSESGYESAGSVASAGSVVIVRSKSML